VRSQPFESFDRIARSSGGYGNRGGVYNMYRKPVAGSGEETLLFKSTSPQYPTDWSQHGRTIFFTSVDPKTGKINWEVDVFDKLPPRGEVLLLHAADFVTERAERAQDLVLGRVLRFKVPDVNDAGHGRLVSRCHQRRHHGVGKPISASGTPNAFASRRSS
jgi:hypothetical protein